MIIADTDVLIDFLSGVQPAARQVRRHIESEDLQTTAVTVFELLAGAGDNRRGEATKNFVNAIEVLPMDRRAAEIGASIRRQLEGLGQAIGMADSVIAGIALAHNMPLLTRNRKHFDRVPGLKLVDMD